MDEEAKLTVTRYDFAEENGNLVNDLMEEILKEDTKPIGKMQIIWKKMGDEENREINLLDEIPATAATPFQMKERGKSILVTMNADLSTPDVLKALLKNKLAEFDKLVDNVVDKKKVVIDCKEVEDAKRAEALLKADVKDARVTRN